MLMIKLIAVRKRSVCVTVRVSYPASAYCMFSCAVLQALICKCTDFAMPVIYSVHRSSKCARLVAIIFVFA